ncbi:MAG: hypothetical protein LKF81_11875 [Prevotella sp.]|nr:hypothetical protein [Prevotella sp.]
MDKITIIKMLLASQDENRQLQARLDKQDEEARLREDRLNSRIDELTRLNKSGSESQIRLMDQLAELQRQLKQMSGQYGEMLIELKKQEDLNRIARKEKYASRRQSVKKEGKNDRNKDRQILRLLGIEIGGKPLGRPSKEQNTKEHHDLMARNVGERNEVEATFGTGKRITGQTTSGQNVLIRELHGLARATS